MKANYFSMKTNITIDKFGQHHTFYIKCFRFDNKFNIDNKKTILFDFSNEFIECLRNQIYDLDKIRLVFLFRHPLRTTQSQHVHRVFNRVFGEYSMHVYQTYGIYLKVDDIYDYEYKNNTVFQRSMNFGSFYSSGSSNCILIHPDLITTIIPHEITEYFFTTQMYDVAIDLLKKRLCQEIMIDIDKIRRPAYNYDEI